LPCEQLKIADNYSGGELDDALAAARQSIVYSCEEAGAEVDEGRALIEALYLAVAILHDRLSGHGASMRI
jgi:hypothetical protein